MSKGLMVGLIVVACAVVLGGCPLMVYNNREISLRQSVLAQQKKNENVFDRVWKVISQQAQVADKYKDQFKDIYMGIMTERYKDGEAQLAKFVQETSPTYSPDLMKTLMSSIEANRRDFEREQNALIDKSREHNLVLQQFPASLYTVTILGRKPIDITIVTSERTAETFKSGQDNNVDVFGGNK